VGELSEIGVLVVDCQTTGATPALGSVLEIGWGVTRANTPEIEQLQAHWVALPEKHVVGFQVRRLTGFDESEVTSALAPREAWERLRAATQFAERMPAAIHFAKFELAFLRDWSEKFEPGAPFPFEAVCVHAIACRLYPDLPRRSLRALAGFLGHGVHLARRSLGHVEATAFIWQKLVAELASRGVTTWDGLGDWLAAPMPAHGRPRKRRYPLPRARYRALPDEPGVYRFVRSNGDILYVGKAASLRKRVAGHFTAGTSTTERALEMLTQVHDILVTPTRTALEAALLENEAIKTLRPPYNVQLVGDDPRTWFTTKDLEGASNRPDETYRRGPFPSTFAVRALGAIRAIALGEKVTRALRARAVEAPERWAPDEDAFAAGFAAFADRHALAGPEPARPKNLDRALVAAAKVLLASKLDADETPEEESSTRTWDPARVVRHLERAVAHGYQLQQRARWLCLLYDSAIVFREPTQTGGPRLLLVRDGRLVEARELSPGEPIPGAGSSCPMRERQAAFDRHHYDRLRTLTTELKRVLRDEGSVEVRVGRARWLRARELDGLLRWV
jgi:DNA polymerase III epsilon subunit-like protein